MFDLQVSHLRHTCDWWQYYVKLCHGGACLGHPQVCNQIPVSDLVVIPRHIKGHYGGGIDRIYPWPVETGVSYSHWGFLTLGMDARNSLIIQESTSNI